MSPNPLWTDSGQTPERRSEEADELVGKLADAEAAMMEHEAKFLRDMQERFERYGNKTMVSPKQLFWLRDLLEKYL
jgi:hypothetical protein